MLEILLHTIKYTVKECITNKKSNTSLSSTNNLCIAYEITSLDQEIYSLKMQIRGNGIHEVAACYYLLLSLLCYTCILIYKEKVLCKTSSVYYFLAWMNTRDISITKKAALKLCVHPNSYRLTRKYAIENYELAPKLKSFYMDYKLLFGHQ